MNIKYSDKLFLFLKEYDAASISFGIEMPSSIEKELTNSELPNNFGLFENYSAFL